MKPVLKTWTKHELAGLFCLILLLFAWTLAPLQGYDYWVSLSMGRDIFETWQIPWSQSYLGATDIYAFGRYANHAWLSSLVIYLFYLVAGIPGLIVCKSLLLTSITAVTYLNCRTLGLTPVTAGWWVTLGLWTVKSRFLLRTYLFTDLCLAFLVLIFLKTEQSPRKKLVSLAVLFCLWSNFHQGVIAGWFFVFLWVVGGGTDKWNGLKMLLTVFVATLIRPRGWTFPAFLYDHFTNEGAMTGVLEWRPLSLEAVVSQLGPFLLIASLLLIGGLMSKNLRRSSPWHFLLIALFFLVLALRSQRAVAELFPVVFPLLVPFFPKLELTRRQAVVFFAGLALLFYQTTYPPDYNRLTALYPLYPIHLSETVKPLPGQVFNSYEFGNYLGFQNIPPFIHGMTGLFSEQLVNDFESVLNPTEKRWEIVEKFQISSFLLHFPTEEDATENLVETLSQAPGWKLEEWDDSGLVFLKGNRETGLTAVRPWSEEKWTDIESARSELETLVGHRPSARAYLMLTQLASEKGDWESSKRYADKALEIEPSAYQGWQALSVAAAQLHDSALTLEASEQAVKWGPDRPRAHFNRALALIQVWQTQSGIRAWYTKRQIRRHLEKVLLLDPEFKPAQQLLRQVG